MLVYVITFIVALFFVHRAQLNDNKVFVVLYLLMGAIIPSFVAGVRDLSIGVDINVYAVPCYDLANSTNFEEYTVLTARWGVLYPLLIYLGNLMGSLSWGLGFVEFFVCLNVLIALYIQKRKMSITVGYFIFLFMFYNMSLNLMRQSMALSCCVLAFSLIIKSRYKTALIPLLLGFGSHSSMVIFALLLFEFYLFVIRSKKNIYIKVFYLGLPLLVIFYQVILRQAIGLGFLSDHYEAYGEGSKTYFSFTNTFSQLCLLILLRLVLGKNDETMKKYGVFSSLVIYTSFVLTTLSTVSVWAFRAAYYFEISYIILFPIIIKASHKNDLKKLFYIFVVILWFYDKIINGVDGTYPYSSNVLPSLF